MRCEGYGSAVTNQTTAKSARFSFYLKILPLPLRELEATVVSEHEVTPKGIYHHEYDPIEDRFWLPVTPYLWLLSITEYRQTWQ